MIRWNAPVPMAQTFVFALGVPTTAVVLSSWWRGDPLAELVLPLAATGLVVAMAMLAGRALHAAQAG